MKKLDNLQIAKELIFLAWTYNAKKKKEDSKIIIEKIESYKKDIDTTEKNHKTILNFIEDIKNDLLSWKEINLDSSSSDEYIENYFITKNEIDIYNNLILLKQYREVFDILQAKDRDFEKVRNLITEINLNYIKSLKELNSKNIAKNLLIFTIFTRNLPTEAFARLHAILAKFTMLKEEKKIVTTMSKSYNAFIKQIVSDWMEFFKTKTYNYNFLHYKFNWTELEVKDTITNASKIWYRSGNPDYEYQKILSNITKKD